MVPVGLLYSLYPIFVGLFFHQEYLSLIAPSSRLSASCPSSSDASSAKPFITSQLLSIAVLFSLLDYKPYTQAAFCASFYLLTPSTRDNKATIYHKEVKR